MIKGFQGTSLVDFPGKICSVIFLGGCNFRCPFCYNIDLVLPERWERLPDLKEEEIIEKLKKREGFIEGVVISGGEPTIHLKKLRHLLELIKMQTNLSVKLDTNGSFPEVLKSLIEENLVDYIALDLKTSPERYKELLGSWEKVEKTLSLLKTFPCAYEIRMTLVPYFIGKEEIKALWPWLREVPRVALQRFINEVPRLNDSLPLGVYTPEEIRNLQKFLQKKFTGEIILRNV